MRWARARSARTGRGRGGLDQHVGELAPGRLFGLLGHRLERLGDAVATAQRSGDQLEHVGQLIGERRLALALLAAARRTCAPRHDHAASKPGAARRSTGRRAGDEGDDRDHDELAWLHEMSATERRWRARPLAVRSRPPRRRTSCACPCRTPLRAFGCPDRALRDPLAGQQPAARARHQRAEHGEQPAPMGTTAQTVEARPTALAARPSWRAASSSARWSAAPSWRRAGRRRGSTTFVSRSATRAKAAETPPRPRRSDRTEGLEAARSVSAVVRLMASTCSPWTAATACSSVSVLPSSLPSDSTTSTLCRGRREGAGRRHDGVVERGVSVGDEPVDLLVRAPGRSSAGQDRDVVAERLDADADVRRHRSTNSSAAALAASIAVPHAARRVHGEHDLEFVGGGLRGSRAARTPAAMADRHEHEEESQAALHRGHTSAAPNRPAGRVTPRSASSSTNSGRTPVGTSSSPCSRT